MAEKRYLFANWKMYLTPAESVRLARAVAIKVAPRVPDRCEVGLFPSALAFASVAEATKKSRRLKTGAQNVQWLDKGGYTGEVSAEMYHTLHASYALVGHSERRHLFHETNHEVREKMEAVITAGLTPVLCVGETLKERRAGDTDEVVEAQLRAALSEQVFPKSGRLLVAYEPVWAIGTGEACNPEEAERMANRIAAAVGALQPRLKEVAVLYGGSVRPQNIRNYITLPHICGVLVGQASVALSSWRDLVDAACKA